MEVQKSSQKKREEAAQLQTRVRAEFQAPEKAQWFLATRLKRLYQHGFYQNTPLVPTKENGYIQLSFKGANKFCTLGEIVSN